MLLNALLLALRAIRRNLLRSFLTVLGIVIGVSAVITMVTLGNGATRSIQDQIGNMGSNLLTVRPGRDDQYPVLRHPIAGQGPQPLPHALGQRRRSPHIKPQLHRSRDLVDVLPARTGCRNEALAHEREGPFDDVIHLQNRARGNRRASGHGR